MRRESNRKSGVNKAGRTELAIKWIEELRKNDSYMNAISASQMASSYYGIPLADNEVKSKNVDTIVKVFNQDVNVCIKAACVRNRRVAVLDFASYKSIGGGFIKGAVAQEEALCSKSGLYCVLETYDKVYESRQSNLNDGLYGSDSIYCVNVPFMLNNRKIDCYADVVVMAAPNAYIYEKSKSYDKDKLLDVLLERMSIVLYLAYEHGCDCVILGAFGCGVFKNDFEFVASTWGRLLKGKFKGVFDNIVHPVLDKEQYKVFKKYEKIISGG